MTVAELIERLRALPPERTVVYSDEGSWREVRNAYEVSGRHDGVEWQWRDDGEPGAETLCLLGV